MMAYTPLGSVMVCIIIVKFMLHQEECKYNAHDIAVFNQMSEMDIPSGQVDQPDYLVTPADHELYLVHSTFNCNKRWHGV